MSRRTDFLYPSVFGNEEIRNKERGLAEGQGGPIESLELLDHEAGERIAHWNGRGYVLRTRMRAGGGWAQVGARAERVRRWMAFRLVFCNHAPALFEVDPGRVKVMGVSATGDAIRLVTLWGHYYVQALRRELGNARRMNIGEVSGASKEALWPSRLWKGQSAIGAVFAECEPPYSVYVLAAEFGGQTFRFRYRITPASAPDSGAAADHRATDGRSEREGAGPGGDLRG